MRGIGAKIVLHSTLTFHHVINSCIQKTMPVGNAPGSKSVTWESHRQKQSAPDIRFLHFDDVYHVEHVTSTLELLFCC